MKTSEASLGIVQSGSRKLRFRVEANERSSCNRWDIGSVSVEGRDAGNRQSACCFSLSPETFQLCHLTKFTA